MMRSWIYFVLVNLIALGCGPSETANSSGMEKLALTDTTSIRATIDSLTAISDTATTGQDSLLIRIAGLYKNLRDQDAWVRTQRALFSFYHKNKLYEEAHIELEKAVSEVWWEPETQAGQLFLLMGFTLRRLGRNYAASVYYEKARDLSDRFGGVTRANPADPIYKTLANIKTRLGENEEAEKLFFTALDLLDKDSMPDHATANEFTRAEIHNDLGLAYQNTGSLAKALEQYEAGLKTLQRIPKDSPKEAWEAANAKGLLLSSKASVLFLTGDYPAAERIAGAALKSFTGDKTNYRFNTHNILAEILKTSGNFSLAKTNRDTALALAKQGGVEQREIAKLLIEIGWDDYRQNKYEESVRYAQEALQQIYPKISPEAIEQNPDPALINPDPENAIAEALDLKGAALLQLYQSNPSDQLLKLADTTTALAIKMMENLRDAAVYESSKLNSSQQSRRLFSRMMAILYAREKAGDPAAVERAFQFAEKSKAVLLQQKIAADAALREAGVADSLIQQERDLKERRAFLQNEIFEQQIAADDPNAQSVQQLKRRLYAVEQDLRQWQARISAEYKISTAEKENKTASIADVRKQLLRKNELWIEYFSDPDSSWVYIISTDKNSSKFIRKPYREEAVREFIQLFNNEIQAENKSGDPELYSNFVQTNRKLFKTLVEPVLPKQSPERITLVPDGALSLLPFDVLLFKEANGRSVNYTQLPYLLTVSQLRLTPSASLELFYTNHSPAERRGAYAGFAPDYSGSVLGQVVSGPEVVKSAATAFEGDAFTGADAGLGSFLKNAAGHAIIHFHGHAEASDSFPDHSWMAFTAGLPLAGALLPQEAAQTLGRRPGRLPAAELDHCLFAHQVYHSHLDADLVLLSACQTGLGKIAPGEGTLSLSRAFQAAGCPATVMSLWEVRDDATAELMQLFLEKIRLGQDKDEALTNAKRDYLKTSGDAFPYYWAGFVLTGKADPVQLDSPWWKQPIFWAIGISILLVLVVVFRKRRKTID